MKKRKTWGIGRATAVIVTILTAGGIVLWSNSPHSAQGLLTGKMFEDNIWSASPPNAAMGNGVSIHESQDRDESYNVIH